MEFKLEPQLWEELSTWGLREPEEGNPRKKAAELFGVKGGNISSSWAGSAPWSPSHPVGVFINLAAAEPGAANSSTGALSQQRSQEPAGEAAADAGVTKVDRRHASELSYSDFVRDFMAPNVPVVIEGTAGGWKACREWVCPDGTLDLDFLDQHFGSCKVRATDTAREYEGCGPTHDMTLGDYIRWWRRRKLRAAGAAAAAVAGAGAGAAGAGAAEAAAGAGAEAAAARMEGGDEEARQLLYVKDWHFQNDFPGYKAYICPLYFQDDWLNEWYDARRERMEAQRAKRAGQHAQHAQQAGQGTQAGGSSAQQGPSRHCVPDAAAAVAGLTCREAVGLADSHQHGDRDYSREEGREGGNGGEQCWPKPQGGDDVTSDYRFVYLGPKGTWTPLHSDVLRSFSWSTNVAGRKRWRMLHPRYSHLLYDKYGQTMAPDFWVAGGSGSDEHAREQEAGHMFPGLAQARQYMVEFFQEAGESVFVPSGWHHSVENIEDTLSINHNWVNGHNVQWVWHLVSREYSEAEEGIADCRELCSPSEFEALVQRNMGTNCGLDFAALGEFLRCIAGHGMEHFSSCGQHHIQGNSSSCGGSRNGGGTGAAVPKEGAPACGCCVPLPACCAHHTLRLRRVGLVLEQLLGAEERIHQSCSTAGRAQYGSPLCPLVDTPGGHGEQQAGHRQQQGYSTTKRPLYDAEIAANRECLEQTMGILCEMGLGLMQTSTEVRQQSGKPGLTLQIPLLNVAA